MGAPAVDVLLDAWERGLGGTPTRRALGLLGATRPDAGADELADLPLGARDLALLRLRADLFGDRVEAIGLCPSCGTDLDVSFDVSVLLASLPPTEPGPHAVVVEGYEGTVRPPTSADVLAVMEEDGGDDVGARLLGRCVDGRVPDAVVERLSAEVAQIDPGSRIELGLDCDACRHQWVEVLDVVGFVWAEVNAWARRTLREVHLLARAYGWRESDILALDPRRRAAYLQLVAG